MSAKTLTVRALRVKQDGETPLFSFFLRSNQILEIADISRIRKDATGALLGYQRGQVNAHVKEIVSYLNSEEILFPNAIILAVSDELKFTKSRGLQVGDADCVAGILEIPIRPEGQRVAWIVDGQQRTLALMQANIDPFLVPVTGFISDDFEIHRAQFLLVNKAKPLPRSLINELLPEVNTTLPPSLAKSKIPSALCNILQVDPESPFKGLIIRETTDRKKDKTAVIKDSSLIKVIEDGLKPQGCLYQYNDLATGQIDVESIRKVMNLYWWAVKKTFPDAWGKPPEQSRLMGGVGIKSMGALMDKIMASILPADQNAERKILEGLEAIKPHCAWTKGTWEKLNGISWEDLENTSRDINRLKNMLIRVYTRVE
jgi:DGQHR domain-containing protein